MILYTDRPDFFNDICEEIRLFLPQIEIELSETPSEVQSGDYICVLLHIDKNEFRAESTLHYHGQRYSYDHKTPYRGETAIVEKRYAKRCLKISVFRTMRLALPHTSLPWGSLTGIRPTRLLRELKDTEGDIAAFELMRNEFDVTNEKIYLADKIVSLQRGVLDSIKPNDVDIYIGIPFCRTRCLYCSFASQLRTIKTDMDAYLTALKADITNGVQLVSDAGLNIRSIYLGGGTPTILTASELRELLDHVLTSYAVKSDTEFTVEAGRPDTITPEKLRIIKEYGANRISINPQTMCNSTLRSVGRDHTAEDIENCFKLARDIGFDSINMDLIAGLPGENADDMHRSIDAIARLNPDCLTVHTLAIKRSSRLKEQLDEFILPDTSEVERMTAIGALGAERMGMLPYYMYRQKYMAGNMENVGYSKTDKICIYNIDMMEDALSIIAHGAGAMSKRVFPDGHRIERVPNPKDFVTFISKIQLTHEERLKLWNA